MNLNASAERQLLPSALDRPDLQAEEEIRGSLLCIMSSRGFWTLCTCQDLPGSYSELKALAKVSAGSRGRRVLKKAVAISGEQ